MPALSVQNNPYIVGPPIKDPRRFFGRKDLFRFIASSLRSEAKVILLRGQRRIGKSSVLSQIPLQADLQEFVFAPIDFQYVALQPIENIIHEMCQKIAVAPALQ